MRSRVIGLGLCLVFGLLHVEHAHAFTVTRISGSVLNTDIGKGLTCQYEGYSLTNNDATAYADVWVQSQDFGATAKIQLATSSGEDGIQHVGPMAINATQMAFFYLCTTANVAVAESHNIRVFNQGTTTTTITTQAFSLTAEDAMQANSNKVTSAVFTPSGPGIGNTLVITVTGDTGTVGGAKTVNYAPATTTAWRPDAFQLESTSVLLTGGNTGTVANQLAFTLTNSSDTHYVATFTFRIAAITTG